jgi:hypothetical protein
VINIIEGKINLGGKNILAVSTEELNALAEEGLIEKRKDNVGTYYYVEDEADGMRFRVYISMREKRIEWLRLHWLDSPIKGWDDVSDKAMMDEYHLLSNFVEKKAGRPPDNKRNRERTWSFKWGDVEVSNEPRAYQADIFMKPR